MRGAVLPRGLSRLLLGEECADELALIFVLDPREEFLAEVDDGGWFVEGALRVHLAAGKVARLALRFEDRLDLFFEIDGSGGLW
jgi:hypothetical protein